MKPVLGAGSGNSLDTSVGVITVANDTGVIGLVNDREITVTSIRNNGDIFFTSLDGDVILDNSQDIPYDRDDRDANIAGAVINANYGFETSPTHEGGVIVLDVFNGDVRGLGPVTLNQPDLAAREMRITTAAGSIGSGPRPLVIYGKDLVTFLGRQSWQPRWAFNTPPAEFENLSNLTLDISALLQASADLLIEVESLDEVDPAIFTGVRNYSYDNISIKMPRDQLFDEEEDELEEEDLFL